VMVLVHMNDAVRLPLWFNMWAAQCFEEKECSKHEWNPSFTDAETHQNTRASCSILHMHDHHQDTFTESCIRHGSSGIVQTRVGIFCHKPRISYERQVRRKKTQRSTNELRRLDKPASSLHTAKQCENSTTAY
jgi:hypothetical protein